MSISGLFFYCRIIKRLGCPNCQPRGRSFTADQLRGKVRLSLNKLRILNQQRFEKYFFSFNKMSFSLENFFVYSDIFLI